MNNTYYEESGSGAASNKVSVNRAQFLGKWIWMLFLLSIFSILLGILDNEYIKKAVPGIYMIGQILPSIFNAACGVILFKLSSEEKKYRIAGICTLISLTGSILAETLFRSLSPESLIIWMPLLIVGLVESYYENHAHSIVLRDMDDELSEKWIVLWKWELGCILVYFGSAIVMMFIPIVGALVASVTGIGIIILGVLRLIYLYRTAKKFREYQPGGLGEL